MGQVIGKWADRVLLAEDLADFFAWTAGKKRIVSSDYFRESCNDHPSIS